MIMLQPYLYEIIRKLVQKRHDDHVCPYVASEREVFFQVHRDIEATLIEMEEDGLISHYENVNGIKMFREIEKEDEDNNVQ